ncbi:MAG: ParA family protein [Cellulomonadaceae bacterium]
MLLWDLDPQGAATFLLGVKPKLKGGAEALVRGKRIVVGVRKAPPVLGFLSMVDRRKTVHRDAVANLPERADVLDVVVPYVAAVERMCAERAPLATFAPRVGAAGAYTQLWTEVAQRLSS